MKLRLDELVVTRGLAKDIREAQGLILAGKIVVGEERVDKVGVSFKPDVPIRKKGCCPFVSRGGYKIEKGLTHFNIDPTGFVCADIGASSGGFTDCLLQRGAKKVYAIDVAYGQLDWKIRQDDRVVVMERFNARKITQHHVKEGVDLVVIDASFISLSKLIIPLIPLFKHTYAISILALIKPQFELPKNKIGENGVVQTDELREEAIDIVRTFCLNSKLKMATPTPSPIIGPKGNKEYLVHISA